LRGIQAIFAKLCQITGSLTIFCLTASSGVAQIVPDTTLPINSTVTSNGNTVTINGGTTADGNLFHSFERFGVSTGAVAVFNNARGIENIISRVTGRSLSNIDGEIRANGTANVFLLNPNGIIFGSNARLNIGGSFFASTAQSLKFADGKQFSATNPQSSSLLTVSVPVGLQYGVNPSSIVNRSRASDRNGNIIGLQVPTGKTLGLIGGNVALEGGYLSSPQGRIELGSVGNNSFVSLTPIDAGFALGYQGVGDFQDINLSQQASVNASGEGGGDIQVRGGKVTLAQGANIVSDTFGNVDGGDIIIGAERFRVESGAFVGAATFGNGTGGNIAVRAKESVEMSGTGVVSFQLTFVFGSLVGTRSLSDRQIGGLFTGTADRGRAGNIGIDTIDLVLRDGAAIAADSLGEGAGGNLQIRAANSVEIIGSGLSTVSIVPGVPFLGADLAPTGLSTQGIPAGDAGNITIDTGRLIVRDEGLISASTLSDGAGGNIAIKASKSVELLEFGGFLISPSSINSLSLGATGVGGNITIDTGRLIVRGGAVIATNSGAPSRNDRLLTIGGRGGNLTVNASESIEFTGSIADGQLSSGLSSRTFTDASAGEIKISTGRLILQDGGQVATNTSNKGRGGTVVINANSIELSGSSQESAGETGLFSTSGDIVFNPFATGTAGNLRIVTDELIVRDGAFIAANSLGSGDAGTLEIMANAIRLDNQGKLIATTTSGEGGNINLLVREILQLRNNSLISAEAGGTGNGGNITIDSKFIVAVPQENSDIIANAVRGKGGNINITTQGIFGLESRDRLTPLSDITASSEFGLDGVVEISSPDVDPSRGLVELPSVPGVPKPLQGCQAREGRSQSSFVNAGRGGVPPSPTEPLSSNEILEDVKLPAQWEESLEATKPRDFLRKRYADRIVEAQGWLVNERGQVVLSAQVFPQTQFGCKLTQSDSGTNSESTNGSGTTQP
jgi:filamentous hemagglutinin family protein